MPRMTKDQTYQKLRRAVVEEAVEKGFAGTGVAGVVNRAKVSAGTIYVHFENKDEMLRRVYLELKAEFHDRVTEPRGEPDTRTMIHGMWRAMFDFVREDPKAFLFLEFGNAAGILTPEQKAITDGYARDIADLLQRGVDDGTLAPLDSGLLSLLLVAPALQLARGAALAGRPITDDIVEQTFERVWLSIANS
ncbi:TetR/AcrR family transcriptional regulator [Tropicimonas sediminicola]|uniref:Transcriptional regulator, TetR family n=1 Tax=Tropicimonas sediminicola TaxID=1031541 RepID=A0A239M9V7_9RHOB|nr:TetR/AcrR family transcriptional regulator [Tropicimonas sediminicola]SNT38873.1 transcriptional regulator, TetR family [Tropicimonas sediminicola]